jgi:drug/metabolite transporter (DMT)-like permease
VDRRAWLSLIVLASIWGASYMFIKIGLRDLSAPMLAWARIGLAALVLVPVAASQGALGAVKGRVGTLTILAAAQVAGPFLLIALGEHPISSALAGILVATAPIFTVVLAIWVDHDERAEGMRLVGIVLGIAGVVALFGVDLSGSGLAILGGLAVVLAGLGYAVGGFIVKHRFADSQPIGVAAWVMVASTILLTPAAAITAPSSIPALGPAAAVAVLGVLGTGIAFAIFYTLIRSVGPGRSLLVAYLAPAFAVVYGATLLGESVTVATVIGLLLIVAGSWLAAGGLAPAPVTTAQAEAPPLRASEAAAIPGSAPRPGGDGVRPGPRQRASSR